MVAGEIAVTNGWNERRHKNNTMDDDFNRNRQCICKISYSVLVSFLCCFIVISKIISFVSWLLFSLSLYFSLSLSLVIFVFGLLFGSGDWNGFLFDPRGLLQVRRERRGEEYNTCLFPPSVWQIVWNSMQKVKWRSITNAIIYLYRNNSS